MSIFAMGAEITALRRAALAELTRAIQAGEDPALVGAAFEEEYRVLAGGALPPGSWERLLQHAQVCAVWLPGGVPEPVTPGPARPELPPELPPGWYLERCDHTGYPTRYGAHWQAVGPWGQRTDPDLHQSGAAFWARRAAAGDALAHEEPEEDEVPA